MAFGLSEVATPDLDAGVIFEGASKAGFFSDSGTADDTGLEGPIGEAGEASFDAGGVAPRGGLPLGAVGVEGEERGVFGLKLFFGVVVASVVGVSGDDAAGETMEAEGPGGPTSFFALGRGEGGLKPERAANFGAILEGVVGVDEAALGAVEVGVDLRGEADVVGVPGGDRVASAATIFCGFEDAFNEDADLDNDTEGLVGDAGKDLDAGGLTEERAPFFVGSDEGGAKARVGGLAVGGLADVDSGNLLSSVLGLSTVFAGETGGLAAALTVLDFVNPVGVFTDAGAAPSFFVGVVTDEDDDEDTAGCLWESLLGFKGGLLTSPRGEGTVEADFFVGDFSFLTPCTFDGSLEGDASPSSPESRAEGDE